MRQLSSWEKRELIPRLETYVFPDIVALRTLAKLRRSHIPASRIRRAVTALREKLLTVSDPLKELKIFPDGKRIAVQIEGGTMEPLTGQLLLDFEQKALRSMLPFPRAPLPRPGRTSAAGRQFEAALWFEKALDLEQTGAPVEQVIEAYRSAIELDPTSAAALVNLGTVHFHLRNLDEAERYYREASKADPEYALAHFNLGNLFDEKGDRSQALVHYMMAIRLNPAYSDAHYNLALLYQASGQVLRAVRHWKAYLKLDSASSWAAIARQELEKLRRATIVKGSGTRHSRRSAVPGVETVS